MDSNKNQSSQDLLGTTVRLYWMLIGNLVLFFTAVGITRSENPLPLAVFFFTVLISLVFARYADIKFLGGQLADASAPATIHDWKRYSISISLLSLTALATVTTLKWFIL